MKKKKGLKTEIRGKNVKQKKTHKNKEDATHLNSYRTCKTLK